MKSSRILGVAITFAMLAAVASARAQCVVPNTIANGQQADASKVMGNFNALNTCINNAPAGSANSVQVNGGSGTFAGVGPLTNGQLVIGSTGAAPQPATLTAGSGISITNAAGAITIAASGGGGGATYTTPTASTFSWIYQPAGATQTAITGALQLQTPTGGGSSGPHLLTAIGVAAPTPPYTYWARISPPLPVWLQDPNYQWYGIVLSDGSGKAITFNFYTTTSAQYQTWSDDNSQTVVSTISANLPLLIGVYDDGTNLHFLGSYDGVSSYTFYSVSRTAYLTAGPTEVGVAADSYGGKMTLNIASWANSLPGPL